MKSAFAVLASLLLTGSAAAHVAQSHSTTGHTRTDPDCLPNYNDYHANATFDDLTGTVADGPNFLLHYGHLKLTGWRLAAQPQGAPHVTPVSPPNFIRAHDSTGSFNSTSISSTGALLKFRSFFFGCERDTDFVPVPCALRVTGFNATGHAQHKIGSIDVEYLYGAPGANGQAPMQQITGDTLRNLTVSSYYVFETVPAGASTFKPRLVLDNVDYVYYQTV